MKLNAGKDSKFTVADPCQGEPCKTGQKYHKLLKTRLSQLRHYISFSCSKFSDFLPIRISAPLWHTFSSWDSCNCKSTFILSLTFALSLSQKTNPVCQYVVFTQAKCWQHLQKFGVECWMWKKIMDRWSTTYTSCKTFCRATEMAENYLGNEGKIREIRVGICCHLPRTSEYRISCTQLFVWFVILPGTAASIECLKWRGKKLWSGCLQNNLPIRGVFL